MAIEVPANRLRELRDSRNLKVYDIAAMVRRDPSTIYGWEAGKGTIPEEIKFELAAFYEVSPAYLMGWSDKVEAA